jgi:hypothetical protein
MMRLIDVDETIVLTHTPAGWTVGQDDDVSDPQLVVLALPASMQVGSVSLTGPEQTRISQSETPITITGGNGVLYVDLGSGVLATVIGAVRFILTEYAVVDEALIESLGMGGPPVEEPPPAPEEGEPDAPV